MKNTRIGASERRWKNPPTDDEYVLVGRTISNDSTWCFDRLRMYSNSTTALVQLRWRSNGQIIDTQPFHAGGGWTASTFEHDFTFDLSANTNNDEIDIMMTGLSTNPNDMTEVYAYPTGYSASRGKNSQITYWDLNYFNALNNGATHGYFIVRDNPLSTLKGANLTGAIYMMVKNCNLDSQTLDDLMVGLDSTGYTGGTYDYTNNAGNPTAAVRSNYLSLKAKSWTIEGVPPPADEVPSGQSYYMLNETNGTTYADAGSANNTATRRGGSHAVGKLGNGWKGLTAVGNDIQVPNVSAYDVVDAGGNLQPHTISFWFKTSNTGLTWQMLAGRANMFYCALYNGTLRWVIFGGSSGSLERRSYQFSFYNDTWYCVTIAFDGGDTVAALKMYINGVHVDRSTTVGTNYGTTPEITTPFVFGNHYNGSNSFGLDGVIDEICIDMSKEWDIYDVSAYYNNGGGVQRSKPNSSFAAIGNLAVNTIHRTGVRLTCTAPPSDYTIDRYEVYVDGVLNNTCLKITEIWVKDLVANTSYSNVRVRAIDVYGNANADSNSVSFTTTSSAVFPTFGVQAYYTLDNTLNDSVGANHIGSLGGGASYDAGKIANGVSYTGAGYTTVPTSYFSGDSSWSLSMWIKIDALPASRTGLAVIRPQNTGGMHLLIYSDGRILYGRWNGGSTWVTPTIGSWCHVVGTYDNSTRVMTMYVDGVQDNELTLASNQPFAFSGDMLIGRAVIGELEYVGDVDEVTLHNRKMTKAEVVDLYNNGNGLQYS
jgi:hypothetical protein